MAQTLKVLDHLLVHISLECPYKQKSIQKRNDNDTNSKYLWKNGYRKLGKSKMRLDFKSLTLGLRK